MNKSTADKNQDANSVRYFEKGAYTLVTRRHTTMVTDPDSGGYFTIPILGTWRRRGSMPERGSLDPNQVVFKIGKLRNGERTSSIR